MTRRKNNATAEPYALVPIDSLVPSAINAKLHPDTQIDKIAASIREFGFLAPVVADEDGNVLAGHGRLLAAKKLGLDTVPRVLATNLTPAQQRAYTLADNRIGETAWDKDLLKVNIELLTEDGFDLELTGFEAFELNFEGWDSDIDGIKKVGETNDPLEGCVKLFVPQEGVDALIEWLEGVMDDCPIAEVRVQ